MTQTKWNRSLGTSKREQGIYTPKAPQNRKAKNRIERYLPVPVKVPQKQGFFQKVFQVFKSPINRRSQVYNRVQH